MVKRRRESSHLPPLNRPIHTKQTTARGCSPGPCGVPRVHPPGAPACSPAAALPCGRWSIVATPSLLFRWDTSRSGCPPLTLSPPASPRTRTLRDGPGRRAGEELYRPGHHSVLVPPMPPTRLLYACPLSKAPTPRAKRTPERSTHLVLARHEWLRLNHERGGSGAPPPAHHPPASSSSSPLRVHLRVRRLQRALCAACVTAPASRNAEFRGSFRPATDAGSPWGWGLASWELELLW